MLLPPHCAMMGTRPGGGGGEGSRAGKQVERIWLLCSGAFAPLVLGCFCRPDGRQIALGSLGSQCWGEKPVQVPLGGPWCCITA